VTAFLPETARAFDVPMRIGVISDTHIYVSSRRVVPPQVFDLFRRAGVSLIIHLGDVNASWVLDELTEVAPVMAVFGNNDDDELTSILPLSTQFRVGKWEVGAIHGFGGQSARQVVTERFAGVTDLALFGHSHIPYLDRVNDTILFNPGPATDRRWHPHFGIGVIGFTEERIEPELIVYSDPAHLEGITFTPLVSAPEGETPS
jgi:putative phosphoesterase